MPTYDPTEHEDEREERARKHDAFVIMSGGKVYVMGVEKPFEYFCWKCGQIRLCLVDREPFAGCRNCGNDGQGEFEIIAAAPGHLKKDKLKAEWKQTNEHHEDTD